MLNFNPKNILKNLDDKFENFPSTSSISTLAKIHSTAIINGVVIISDGAIIDEYVVINGPCFVGKNVHVGSFCKLRRFSYLDDEVVIENQVEVKHSLIGKSTHIHSGYIGDSLLGEDCRIGAGFITANRRLDRKNIKIPHGGKMVDTDSTYLGCIIGDRVRIGIHCGTNPGTIISDDSHIFPMTIISNPKKSSKK